MIHRSNSNFFVTELKNSRALASLFHSLTMMMTGLYDVDSVTIEIFICLKYSNPLNFGNQQNDSDIV